MVINLVMFFCDLTKIWNIIKIVHRGLSKLIVKVVFNIVVKIIVKSVNIVVKIAVIASPSTSSVSIFDIF